MTSLQCFHKKERKKEEKEGGKEKREREVYTIFWDIIKLLGGSRTIFRLTGNNSHLYIVREHARPGCGLVVRLRGTHKDMRESRGHILRDATCCCCIQLRERLNYCPAAHWSMQQALKTGGTSGPQLGFYRSRT